MTTSDRQPAYRAYILDSNGHIKLAHHLTCETYDQAIAAAQEYVDGHAVELWDRGRKVTCFPPVERTE